MKCYFKLIWSLFKEIDQFGQKVHLNCSYNCLSKHFICYMHIIFRENITFYSVATSISAPHPSKLTTATQIIFVLTFIHIFLFSLHYLNALNGIMLNQHTIQSLTIALTWAEFYFGRLSISI